MVFPYWFIVSTLTDSPFIRTSNSKFEIQSGNLGATSARLQETREKSTIDKIGAVSLKLIPDMAAT